MRSMCIVILFLSWASQASSLVEQLKSDYEQFIINTTQTNVLEPMPEKSLPESFDENGFYEYFSESSFGAKVAVLQTGMLHKETIVLVHGLGKEGMKYWFPIIPHLAKRFHVIAIDLPGFGYSQGINTRYSPTLYAKVLNDVVQQFSPKGATIIGHSMGGAVSIRFAAMYPSFVNKLVLVGVAGILHKTAFVKHSSYIDVENGATHLYQLNDFIGGLVENVSESHLSRKIETSELSWTLFRKSLHLNTAFGLLDENFSLALRQVKAETIILWGDKDNVTPLRTAKVLNGNISNSQLAIINGAAHVPMSTHTNEFLQLLELGLSRQLPEEDVLVSEAQVKNLHCNNEDNITYSGSYNEITINRCNNVVLTNVVAKKLTIKDSLVSAENLVIDSDSQALNVFESVLTLTNGRINTHDEIALEGSRIDFAGVSITAPKTSLKVGIRSKLIFSVSALSDAYYDGQLHGAYKLKNQSLSQVLTNDQKL